MNIYIIEKVRTKANLTNKDLPSSSSDHESSHERGIDASPSAATAVEAEAAATNEDVFGGYSALTNRVVNIDEPPVYCAIDISLTHNVVLPDEVSKTTPVYANIV